jgi:hypothetical protein
MRNAGSGSIEPKAVEFTVGMPSNAPLMKEVQEAQRQMAAEFAAVRESEEDDGEQKDLEREVECAVRGAVAFGEGTRRTDRRPTKTVTARVATRRIGSRSRSIYSREVCRASKCERTKD